MPARSSKRNPKPEASALPCTPHPHTQSTLPTPAPLCPTPHPGEQCAREDAVLHVPVVVSGAGARGVDGRSSDW